MREIEFTRDELEALGKAVDQGCEVSVAGVDVTTLVARGRKVLRGTPSATRWVIPILARD